MEAAAPAEIEAVALADEQRYGAPATQQEHRRKGRGAGGPTMDGPPGARTDAQQNGASAEPDVAGRQYASLPPADRLDVRPGMSLGATPVSPGRNLPGGQDEFANRGSSRKEHDDEDSEPHDVSPGLPPIDPAALLGPLMAMPTMLASILPTLLAPLSQGNSRGAPPGTSSGFDPNFGRATGDPFGGDTFARDGIDDFGRGSGERGGGFDPIPATPEGVLGFLRELLDHFGLGGTPLGTAAKVAEALVGGVRGDGAALNSYRGAAMGAANTEVAIDNLQDRLRSAIRDFEGDHSAHRHEIAELIREVEPRLRAANRLPERERNRQVQQILDNVLLDAERILGAERAVERRTVREINEIAQEMAKSYLDELGPGSNMFDRLMNSIRIQESAGSGGYAARNPDSGALGAYQIMPQNLNGVWGNWDREALGRDVSIAEFRNSPAIQDAIARYKMAEYVEKYGPARALAAWYGGERNVHLVNTTHAQAGGYPSFNRYVTSVLGRI